MNWYILYSRPFWYIEIEFWRIYIISLIEVSIYFSMYRIYVTANEWTKILGDPYVALEKKFNSRWLKRLQIQYFRRKGLKVIRIYTINLNLYIFIYRYNMSTYRYQLVQCKFHGSSSIALFVVNVGYTMHGHL